jgi:hypothetical protein
MFLIHLVRARRRQPGVRNLEGVEMGLREAIFRDLCKVLEELLNDPAPPVPEDVRRPKEVLTLFGRVSLSRNYSHAAVEQTACVPLDRALGS